MKITELGNSDDLNKYLKSYKYCILKFSATWCGPCQKISNELITNLINYTNDNVIIINIDYDEHGEVAENNRVTQLPTLFIIENNKIKDKIIGTNLNVLYNFLNNIINK